MNENEAFMFAQSSETFPWITFINKRKNKITSALNLRIKRCFNILDSVSAFYLI